jgi:hypothetical protein
VDFRHAAPDEVALRVERAEKLTSVVGEYTGKILFKFPPYGRVGFPARLREFGRGDFIDG